MGTLYVVSTPIGNLEDITLRALRVLKEVALIACEDTRVTRRLLEAHGIDTPTRSYHAHSDLRVELGLLAELAEGKDVALVSDAGTPLLSDPGAALVEAAIAAGHPVVPIPGASALLSALVASGIPAHPFLFFGFLPRHSGERTELLGPHRQGPYALVFYEATHRLRETLADLARILGDRPACVGRELTKKFEELARGTLLELAQHFGEGARGEAVIIVGRPGAEAAQVGPAGAEALALQLLAQGERTAEIAKAVAATCGLTKQEAYALVLSLRGRPTE